MVGRKDADATDPEVFSGPATKPSLEKPIEARTSISEVPDHRKRGEGHSPLPEAAVKAGRFKFDDEKLIGNAIVMTGLAGT